jgi:YfiH family protein
MRNEEIREAGSISYLSFGNLNTEGVLHGFSLRHGGVSASPYHTLNLGEHVGDDALSVQKNRIRLAVALDYQPEDVTVGQQVHGTHIARVTAHQRGLGHFCASDALPETDGLVTTEPGIVLMAHSADCTLLFFHDPQRNCIALAHAGWRGAVAGMAEAMVEEMALLGCLRENIRVALSPSIGPCCYRVGENVVQATQSNFRDDVFIQKQEGIYFDLPGLQARQLMTAGIREENLLRSRYCTNCHHELFFSYRASGGTTGRMAGVIAMNQSGRRSYEK